MFIRITQKVLELPKGNWKKKKENQLIKLKITNSPNWKGFQEKGGGWWTVSVLQRQTERRGKTLFGLSLVMTRQSSTGCCLTEDWDPVRGSSGGGSGPRGQVSWMGG